MYNPRTTKALQNEITRVIGSITVDQLQKVSHNLFMRCDACLQALSAPVIKHGKFVLSFYSILTNVRMYRKLCEGMSDTTAFSLAGKGTVVAEKRSIRSVLLSGFLYGWTLCTSSTYTCSVMLHAGSYKTEAGRLASFLVCYLKLQLRRMNVPRLMIS
jgi:hypothetical protein